MTLTCVQVREGAVGVCCQTVTEAEAMVEGGVNDVFVSNEVNADVCTYFLCSFSSLC